MTMELKPCPFCGSYKLSFQYRQARGSRIGNRDASIYCRACGCFGRRVKSEDLDIPRIDPRNEIPTKKTKEVMREAAIEAWNRRVNDAI